MWRGRCRPQLCAFVSATHAPLLSGLAKLRAIGNTFLPHGGPFVLLPRCTGSQLTFVCHTYMVAEPAVAIVTQSWSTGLKSLMHCICYLHFCVSFILFNSEAFYATSWCKSATAAWRAVQRAPHCQGFKKLNQMLLASFIHVDNKGCFVISNVNTSQHWKYLYCKNLWCNTSNAFKNNNCLA